MGLRRKKTPRAGGAHPQKVDSGRKPLRGRLQPNRQPERDFSRKKKRSGVRAPATFYK